MSNQNNGWLKQMVGWSVLSITIRRPAICLAACDGLFVEPANLAFLMALLFGMALIPLGVGITLILAI